MEKKRSFELVNPSTGEVTEVVDAGELFDLIVYSAWRNGEPGMIFLDEINRHNPTPQLGEIEATNPCVTADTWVMTEDGPKQVSELIGCGFVGIINGEKWKSNDGFFSKGVKPVYRLRKVKKMTRHAIETEWVRAGELEPGDRVVINNHRNFKGWKGRYNENEGYLMGLRSDLKMITKEMEKASSAFYRGFLRGLFDADGSVQENQSKGGSIRLSQNNFEVLKAVQRMLLRLGIYSNYKIVGFGDADKAKKT
ncbi:MAG: LAGLIDADG family homing endonuclease [Candidatus Syntropharchaeia archaeon]